MMGGTYQSYRCAVLSTSTGSLSELLDRDSQIRILNLNVWLGHQRFADGLELDNSGYCHWRQQHLDEAITTSPPSLNEMSNMFKYLVKEGYHEAIVTTISHKLSDTAEVLRTLALDFPGLSIHVFDTGSCCMPEGFFALEADRLLRAGYCTGEVLGYLTQLKEHCHIIFGVSSLKPLALGGRLQRAAASFSDWLDLRPVLKFSADQLSRIESAADDEAMFDTIIAQTEKLLAGKAPEQFFISGLYSGEAAFFQRFAQRFEARTGLTLGKGVPVSPAVAVHVGISGVGIGLVEKPLLD